MSARADRTVECPRCNEAVPININHNRRTGHERCYHTPSAVTDRRLRRLLDLVYRSLIELNRDEARYQQ